jgi:hypothetical protein
MGPPSLPFSTHCLKPLSWTKKSQLRNSCPLRSLPQSPSSLPQPQKAPSFAEDPPLPYSALLNLPSYSRTAPSTNPLSSPPTTRQTSTPTYLVPRPALWTHTITPTSTLSLFRTVRTFGLHKRSSSTKTSYISSPIAKTSQRHSPTLSPLSRLKSFIRSLYRRQAPFPPSSCAPKSGAILTLPPSHSAA